ncbi:MAG TPA: formylglycine-generating enzyme family protein [Fibrobacter sp.]|nr:formylglycine-generating enzyme family protein [Fibrobacter sp.]
MKEITWIFFSFFLVACTNTTEPGTSSGPGYSFIVQVPSSSNAPKSSSSVIEEDANEVSFWDPMWVNVPEQEILVGNKYIPLNSFLILKTEVTQLMFADVMDSLPPQKELNQKKPVASISWYDAALFCNALSKILELDTAYQYSSIGPKNTLLNLVLTYHKKTVRLPTDPEWEAAIRAGTTTDYFWGTGTAADFAHFGSTAGPIEVGVKRPNGYGLYDMAGNVSEWVSDWDGPYGTTNGSKRAFRGGSWDSPLIQLKSNYKGSALPDESLDTRGFRVVLSNGAPE